MFMGSLCCIGGGGGTLRGSEIGEFKKPMVEGEVEEVGNLSFEAMEDEEVAIVDGVFEGAFGVLGDEKGLKVEALVDTMKVMVVDDE
ncbi:hypothetical protein Tco_1183441 [Tanacetum coccineum]